MPTYPIEKSIIRVRGFVRVKSRWGTTTITGGEKSLAFSGGAFGYDYTIYHFVLACKNLYPTNDSTIAVQNYESWFRLLRSTWERLRSSRRYNSGEHLRIRLTHLPWLIQNRTAAMTTIMNVWFRSLLWLARAVACVLSPVSFCLPRLQHIYETSD